MVASALRVSSPAAVPDSSSLRGGALHLAVSRSAAVRLAPVGDAVADDGVPQALLDRAGRIVAPRPGSPPCTAGDRADAAPHEISAAVSAAIEALNPAIVLAAGDGDAAVA